MVSLAPKPTHQAPVFSSAPAAPPPNQDILALLQWIDTVCGAGGNPGALDATSTAMQQGVAGSDVTPMTAWLTDPTDGPAQLKAQLQAIRALLGELAQDRVKLAQTPAPAPAPAKPAAPQGTPVPPGTVTVSAAQAVGMSAGAFVLGGLLGGAVMHHIGGKKKLGAREDDDEDEEERPAARELPPRRKKPAAKTPTTKEE